MKHLSLSFLLLLATAHWAFGQLTITGEIRPRAEFRNGFKSPNTEATEPAFFIEQRSRLYAAYKTEKIGLKIVVQDVRIWGNTSQIYKTDPSLTNFYEAWGEYHFTPSVSLRIGRQELDYDNARFLGDLDWAAQGRSHDAVRFIYDNQAGFALHAGAAFNQNVPFEPGQLSGTYYAGVNNYKTMQYVWLHREFGKGKISALIFNDGRERADTTMFYRQTYGVVGEQTLGKVKLGGELYYQGGKDPAGTKVNALLAAVNVTINTTVTPLTIGVDYLSGSDANDTKNKAFNPLYGTNHKFYGFMDYYYVGNNHGQNGKTAGLVDIYLQTKFKLGKKSALIAHFHHFDSPTAIYATEGTGEKLSSVLGNEIDLVYNLDIVPAMNLKVGYSQIFVTDSMDALKNVPESSTINNWAWAMITFKPELFSSSKP